MLASFSTFRDVRTPGVLRREGPPKRIVLWSGDETDVGMVGQCVPR